MHDFNGIKIDPKGEALNAFTTAILNIEATSNNPEQEANTSPETPSVKLLD
jgi:hypothetical protein